MNRAIQNIEHKGGGQYGGNLPAMSLLVVFLERSGHPLYQGYGGLEVRVRRDEHKMVPLTPADLRRDPKRAKQAVSIVPDER